MWVSVIIPCYNVEAYVAEALDSALAQDYPWLEVIAVDNNSTDGTLAILQTYEAQFPDKIRVLQEKKQGAPAARNTGWRAAKGEWIQFLDADDLLLPGKIRRQMGMVEKTKHAILFIAGTPVYQTLQGVQTTILPHQDAWLGIIRGMELGQTSANLWSNEKLHEISGWDESLQYTQDIDLMFRFLKQQGALIRDTNDCCICRDRPFGRITQSDPLGLLIKHCELRGCIKDYLQYEKPMYWAIYALHCYHAIYFFLRMLATYDLDKANQLYQQILPLGFKPRYGIDDRLSLFPILTTQLLGFYHAEWLRLSLKKIVPGGVWAYWRRVLKKAPRPRKG